MFAVIKSGGRQYKVSVGQSLEVNRLPFEDGKQISLDEVLLISDADRYLVGTPHVANASVLATVTEHKRGKKIIVFKYKSKKRYRHRRGHRQELTVLTIDDIVADGKSLLTGEAPKAKETEEASPEVEAVQENQTPEVETPATETEDEIAKKPRRRRSAKTEEATSSSEE
jgi:large subunit ribosomal protein L21